MKTFTSSPGNITRYTPAVSALALTREQSSSPFHCDYVIRAPSSSYFIEVNFTKVELPPNDDPSSSSSSRPDSKSAPSLTSSQQQQTSHTSRPPGGRHGGDNGANKLDPASCLPNVDVVEVMGGGDEQVRRQLCLRSTNINVPTVFRSKSHVLKLHYSWDPRQSSSFMLTFVFHRWPSKC